MAVEGNTSTVHREHLTAKILTDGVETANGIAIVKGFDGQHYEIVVLSGNKALHTYFNEPLSNIDLSEYDHITTVDSINNSYSHTEGYIYPNALYIKDGNTFYRGDEKEEYLPYCPRSIFAHTLMKKMFEQKGIKHKGFLENNEEFKKLVMPCVKAGGGIKESTQDVVFMKMGQYNYYVLSPIITPFSSTFKSSYLEARLIDFKVKKTGYYEIKPQIWEIKCKMLLIKNGEVFETIKTKTKDNWEMSVFKVFLKEGDIISIRTSEMDDVETNAGARLSLDFSHETSKTLPQITQADFLKEIMQRFCLQFRYNKSGEFEFIATKDIMKATPIDWSNKYVQHSEVYKIGDYAQKNYIEYKQLDKNQEDDCNGVLKINDSTLKQDKKLFSPKFYASARGFLGVELILFDVTDINNVSPQNQYSYLFKLTNINTNRVAIENVKYQDYIDNYYQEVSKVIENKKLIKAWFYLSLNDIVNLDFFKPIYLRQTGRKYILQKVENFIQGRATRCELLEIPI